MGVLPYPLLPISTWHHRLLLTRPTLLAPIPDPLPAPHDGCNACNIRRVRCSGGQPCQRCDKAPRLCEYPAPESDKSALKDELDSLRQQVVLLKRRLHAIIPIQGDAADADRLLHGDELVPSKAEAAEGLADEIYDVEQTHHGRLLKDADGTERFLGETSGATFLDHLKTFMTTLVPWTFQHDRNAGKDFLDSVGKYQTFDSRPLPNPNVDRLELPAPSDMAMMLTKLRTHVQDSENDIHSGGIFWWGDLCNLPQSYPSFTAIMNPDDDTYRSLAFHYVCFALATVIDPIPGFPKHRGEVFFKCARSLIGNPLDTVRFSRTDVPVLTMMAFYLIEVNRRDTAYMYVSLAVHIAIIHGTFRECRTEAERRQMWTLYILDRWLSMLMGRPPTIVDEAIRLPPPCDDDSMPPTAGLYAHVELSRISNYIVCEVYKIAPHNEKPRDVSHCIDQALRMLEAWRTQLPLELKIFGEPNPPDPASCMLHMRYHQLVVLTTRSVFFAAVKRAIALRDVYPLLNIAQDDGNRYVQDCANAARSNILLAQQSVASGRKLLQAGLHFTFNAALVLLLNKIMTIARKGSAFGGYQTPSWRSQEQDSLGIRFAVEIFEGESRTGTNYPKDCSFVLKDLEALTKRYQAYIERKEATEIEGPGGDEGVCKEFLSWLQDNGVELHHSL